MAANVGVEGRTYIPRSGEEAQNLHLTWSSSQVNDGHVLSVKSSNSSFLSLILKDQSLPNFPQRPLLISYVCLYFIFI